MTEDTSRQGLLEQLSRLAAPLWLAGGLCYLVGYLTVNIYLSQFAVSYLNLVHTRYLAAGLLFAVITALVFAGPLVSFRAARDSLTGESHGRIRWDTLLALATANVILMAVMVWVIGLVVTEVDRNDPFAFPVATRQALIWVALPVSQLALAFPVFVSSITGVVLARRRLPSGSDAGRSPLFMQIALAGLFVICGLISLFVFAVDVYPNTSPSFGGGAPSRIQLLVRDDATLERVGIETTSGVTEPIILLDQTDSRILLMTPHQQTVELAVSEFIAIIRDNQ